MSAFTERVKANLEGIEAVSTGICPGCKVCMEQQGFKSLGALERAWSQGKVSSEPSFSWRACESCGSTLGGDREPLHGIIDGEIQHWDGACTDCILYLANGQEP